MKGNPGALLEQACAFGLEGVVSKRLDSPYRSGRREEWAPPSASRATSSSSSATSLVAAMAEWGVCCWRGLKMGSRPMSAPLALASTPRAPLPESQAVCNPNRLVANPRAQQQERRLDFGQKSLWRSSSGVGPRMASFGIRHSSASATTVRLISSCEARPRPIALASNATSDFVAHSCNSSCALRLKRNSSSVCYR